MTKPWRDEAAGRRIDLIVVHCTATKPSQPLTPQGLALSHRQRGFGRWPGYHFYITRDGTLHYVRPLSVRGCHAAGYNSRSIGVCTESGRDDHDRLVRLNDGSMVSRPVWADNRTMAQKSALRSLLRDLHQAFPDAALCGHRDLGAPKACPCYDVGAEMADLGFRPFSP